MPKFVRPRCGLSYDCTSPHGKGSCNGVSAPTRRSCFSGSFRLGFEPTGESSPCSLHGCRLTLFPPFACNFSWWVSDRLLRFDFSPTDEAADLEVALRFRLAVAVRYFDSARSPFLCGRSVGSGGPYWRTHECLVGTAPSSYKTLTVRPIPSFCYSW